MVKARLYIEGGGVADSPTGARDRATMVDTNAEAFRAGWRRFFGRAGVGQEKLDIVVGGGRREAFRLFSKRLAHSNNDEPEKPLLLVDSEGPIALGSTVWQHLQQRDEDRWEQPDWADADSAYLMVQAMKTWFLADPTALQVFFGPEIAASSLQGLTPLEDIPKETALDTLRQATNRCRPRYKKGKVSYDLLANIDPGRVAAACPHAKALLDYLRGL